MNQYPFLEKNVAFKKLHIFDNANSIILVEIPIKLWTIGVRVPYKGFSQKHMFESSCQEVPKSDIDKMWCLSQLSTSLSNDNLDSGS